MDRNTFEQKKRDLVRLSRDVEMLSYKLRGAILELAPLMVDDLRWFKSLSSEQLRQLYDDLDLNKYARVGAQIKDELSSRSPVEE